MSRPSSELGQVLARIDALNGQDPRMALDEGGQEVAKELLYGLRMSARLAAFEPEASAELQMACRAQHISRWHWPRSQYPEGRAGYKRWRKDLLSKHAEVAVLLLEQVGVAPASQQRVAALVRKEALGGDGEAQTLEDVACLVFLEFEFGAFASTHERAKVLRVVRKTWQKMSERAREAALALPLCTEDMAIIEEAVE